jgi:hypothetical protein
MKSLFQLTDSTAESQQLGQLGSGAPRPAFDTIRDLDSCPIAAASRVGKGMEDRGLG